MSDENKRNLVYFESASMRGLYDSMDEWQNTHQKRLLSVSIQQDGGNYCCIALTNPMEVILTYYHTGNGDFSQRNVNVTNSGRLCVDSN
jgi:hypothetical protein